MTTLTTLEDNEGVPRRPMVFTGWPHTRRGLAEVECVEHHRPVNLSQYATLDLHSQQQRGQSPLKKVST